MSKFQSTPADGRFFGLDMGDWYLLLGGSALAGLVVFLS
jgi:hypothetical protein